MSKNDSWMITCPKCGHRSPLGDMTPSKIRQETVYAPDGHDRCFVVGLWYWPDDENTEEVIVTVGGYSVLSLDQKTRTIKLIKWDDEEGPMYRTGLNYTEKGYAVVKREK